MIASILLKAEPGPDPWWDRPDALRALAYALFRAVDPELARALHPEADPAPAAKPGHRPFTLAAVAADRQIRLRLTALTGATGRALERMAGALLCGEPVPFGQCRTRLLAAATDLPPLAETADYSVLARAPFRTRVSLRFPTLTAFSQGGDRHLPLPHPELMLGSWVRRWNEFCAPLPPFSEAAVAGAAARLGVARACLATGTVRLGKGKIVGFTGEVTLEALRPAQWSEAERRVFAALSVYSRFCGTGVRTAQGMGLTLPGEPPPQGGPEP